MTKSKFSVLFPCFLHVFSSFFQLPIFSAFVMRRSAKNCGENAELRKGCGDLRYGQLLPEPMLTDHQWGSLALIKTNFIGSPQDINSWIGFEIYIGKITSTSPGGQWVKETDHILMSLNRVRPAVTRSNSSPATNNIDTGWNIKKWFYLQNMTHICIVSLYIENSTWWKNT